MIIKTFNLKNINVNILPNILIFMLMFLCFIFRNSSSTKSVNLFILTFIVPIIYIGQSVFLTLKNSSILINTTMSVIITMLCIVIFLSAAEIMYCFIYILISVISATFTNTITSKS